MKRSIKYKTKIEISEELLNEVKKHFYGEVSLDFIRCNLQDRKFDSEINVLIEQYGEDAILDTES